MEQPDDSYRYVDPIVPLHAGLVGRMLPGKVGWIADFGIFVELDFGRIAIDGLLRFDQTPYPDVARRYQVGDAIYIVVTAVDCERCKISVALPAEPTPDGWRWLSKGSEPDSPEVS